MFHRSKDRVKPTAYPFFPFHALRTGQLVSALVVAGIMAYFVSELRAGGYRLPWTFILLLSTSTLTTLSLLLTILLHAFHGLNPLLNLALNGTLLALWGVSFALLSWWSSGTLAHMCNRENWDTEIGVGVCRCYKAVFSFALLGVLSTLLALLLDIHIHRATTHRGNFTPLPLQPLDLDSKPSSHLHLHSHSHSNIALSSRDINPNPTAAHKNKNATRSGTGYAALDEQDVPYDQFEHSVLRGVDTGYAGAGGDIGERVL